MEDIPLLIRHLLQQVARDDAQLRARFFQEDGEARLSSGLLFGLLREPAIGNVRSLRNLLWRSLAESPGDTLLWPKGPSASVLPGPNAAPGDEDSERALASGKCSTRTAVQSTRRGASSASPVASR